MNGNGMHQMEAEISDIRGQLDQSLRKLHDLSEVRVGVEADVADLLQKLLLIRNNIRQAAGKRSAANGAQGNQGKWRQEHP